MLILRLLLVYLLAAAAGATETGPRVVASIKPLHSLVAGIMQGVGEPVLLLQGNVSPHDYSLRPSDVRALNSAQVVFWIGPELESFLVKPLGNAPRVRSAPLLQASGLQQLPLRAGGAWEPHTHEGAERDNQDEHEQGAVDTHIWLNPHNAMALVRQIAAVLSDVDPTHQVVYEKNTAAMLKRLAALDITLAGKLGSARYQPYIVFHDAYQYFEKHYGLAAAGLITLSPEQQPGARRVQDIRRQIVANQIVCVFSEPQFEPALVKMLLQDTPAKSGVLDPLGADLPAGPEAYFQLMTGLADSLHGCLGD